MVKFAKTAAALAAVSGLACAASAQVLYSQAPHTPGAAGADGLSAFQGGLPTPPPMYDREIGDDFTVPAAGWTINRVKGSFVQFTDGDPNAVTGADIQVYTISGGVVGGVVATANVTTTTVTNGPGLYFGRTEKIASFDISPIVLSAGTYFIKVNPIVGHNWFWLTSDPTTPIAGSSAQIQRGPLTDAGTDTTWPATWTATPNAIFTVAHDVAFTLEGVIGGGGPASCCFPNGTCQILAVGPCGTAGGTYTGIATCAAANCPQPGSCCKPDGTCSFGLPAACAAANGVFTQGQACAVANCPQPGRCCLADATCSVSLPATCAASGGTFTAGGNCSTACPGGFSITCGTTGTFTDITTGGTGTAIMTLATDDGSVLFTTTVGNAFVASGTSLYASSNGFITNSSTFNTFTNGTLPLNNAGPTKGLFVDWDDLYINPAGANPPGSIWMDTRTENGVQVQIIEWVNERRYANQTGPFGTFEVKIWNNGGGPGGALAQYLYQDMSWDLNGNSSTVGVQWNATSGAAVPGLNGNSTETGTGPLANNSVCSVFGATTGCYANCDNSTQPPILNVADFSCFLNKYAAGDAYANCDNSTQPPVLNVQDFSCFLTKYAAGCP